LKDVSAFDLMFLVYPEASARPEFTVEATWDFEVALVSGLRQPPPRRCRLADLQEHSFISPNPRPG
jgi:hypothetical protein